MAMVALGVLLTSKLLVAGAGSSYLLRWGEEHEMIYTGCLMIVFQAFRLLPR